MNIYVLLFLRTTVVRFAIYRFSDDSVLNTDNIRASTQQVITNITRVITEHVVNENIAVSKQVGDAATGFEKVDNSIKILALS